MKKIPFAFLFWASCVLHAQNVTVKFSNQFSLRDRGLTQKDGATFLFGNFFYCTETDYKGMQFAYTAKLEKIKYAVNIYKYDIDMKELQKASLSGGSYSLGPFPPASILFSGKILLFYYNVLEKGAIQLLYSVVDPETLSMSAGKELYVISEKNVGLFKLEKAVLGNKLYLRLSPDSSKLLVVQSGNTNEMAACIINKDMEAGKAVLSKVKPNMEDFSVQDAVLDNAGNKYFTYSFTEDKTIRNGVLVQNNNGKEAFLSFRTTQDGQDPGTLFLKVSRDNSKVYVFGASVGEMLEEGVMLSTVDASSLKLGKQVIFPYPQDLRERLYKMDFADKKHGNYSVKRAYYIYHELADGTVVLSGYPVDAVTGTHMGKNNMPGVSYVVYYVGPIINLFIREGKGRFGVVYRNQEMGHASTPLIVPDGDKLVCIYSDSEKGLDSDKPEHTDKRRDAGELVPAVAVIGNDGSIISRKKLADRPGSSVFMTNHQQRLTGNTYLVPVGHDRVNLMRYYTEVEQWATVEVN